MNDGVQVQVRVSQMKADQERQDSGLPRLAES
jgi:hypothetical protein